MEMTIICLYQMQMPETACHTSCLPFRMPTMRSSRISMHARWKYTIRAITRPTSTA
ncbi:Uncharacterised protein [Bordetella pertussis]|nr:Uncharacterised protein [Bordetella pertussis]